MADAELNRYVRQKKLGAGAMGEVWLATDTLLNRPVAIKQLKATEDARPKQFFLSEAQMLASLNHPHITQIYDAVFDEEQSRYYLIMEYVEGMSLEDFTTGLGQPLPLEITLDVAIGVLEALQYAHQRDIVHRDIKPANVMIQEDGIKLTDFGVAGLMSVLAEGSDYVVGTPAYMSPEQIEGGALDGRSDLYSFGAMLYTMVSGGCQPFELSTLDEMFTAHLEDEPRPVTDHAPDAPPALSHTIMRLLVKDPEARYPSASAVLEIFRSIKARQKFSQSHLPLLDPEANPLVGRTELLAQMDAVWTESQQTGQPRLLVVRGEMGLGKSRLITEFLGRSVVDQGFVAAAGRCDESGSPYAPFAEILATILNKGLTKLPATEKQLDQLLSHIPGLGRLLDIPDPPEVETETDPTQAEPGKTAPAGGLWATLGSRVPDRTTDPFQTEWQFFSTVLTLLADLDPTAIFIENATFLDEASTALIRFLISQGQFPLLLIAACRETEEALAWLDSFASDERVIINLPPLSASAVKKQLANILGGPVSDEAAGMITERGRGNPLHIEEMARQLLDSSELYRDENGQWHYKSGTELEAPADSFLPKSVLSAFSRRVDKLSERSREALALAALIEPGPEFDYELWLTLLGGEAQTEAAQAVLDEALKLRLVRRVGDQRCAFRPADIGQALASHLPEARRRELHHQLADILESRQADPLLVGHHYEQAGLAAEATRYLETAGAQAMSTHAVNAALAYYGRAVTLVESQSAYRALGQLHRQNGQRAEAIRAFKRAYEFAEEAGDIAAQAGILNEISRTQWLFDRHKKAYRYASAVLKLVGVPRIERAKAQLNLGTISWLVGQLNEAEDWCRKSIMTLMGGENKARLAEAHNRLGQVYVSQGKLAEARTAFEHALKLYQKLEDQWGQGHSLTHLGRLATDCGEFAEAASLLQSAQQRFDRVDSRDGYMAVFTNQGRNKLYQDDPDEALPLLTKALYLAMEKEKRSAHILSDIYLLIAQASLATGEIGRAKFIAHDALKLAKVVGSQEFIALGRATLAQIFAAEKDWPDAEDSYKRALKLFEQIGSRPALLRTRLNYARLLRQRGHSDEAIALEEETRLKAAEMGLFLPHRQE